MSTRTIRAISDWLRDEADREDAKADELDKRQLPATALRHRMIAQAIRARADAIERMIWP